MTAEQSVPNTDSQREGWIDALRGFAIILVIIGHANGITPSVQKFIYGFHMPLFFIIGGYVFHPEKYANVYELATQKFRSYIVPFLSMGFINLVIQAIREAQTMGAATWTRSTLMHGVWLLYSWGEVKKMPNCSPLWFLPCFFIAVILFYLFWTYGGFVGGERPRKKCAVLCMLGAIAAVFYCISQGISHLPWNIDMSVIGAVLMLIGHLCRRGEVFEKLPCSFAFVLLLIGLGVIYSNDFINMDNSQLGNPVLFFVGACSVSFSLAVLSRQVCVKAGKKLRLLEFYGKGTMLVMGYNYVLKTFCNYCWKLLPFESQKPDWITQSIIIAILFGLIILLWNTVKRKYPKIAAR